MQKQDFYTDHIKHIASLYDTLTLSQAKEEARHQGKCFAIVANGKILFDHGFDMLFAMHHITLNDLKQLPKNALYRYLVTHFNKAAEERLYVEEGDTLKGAEFSLTYPSHHPFRGLPGQTLLIRQTSKPFVLHGDGLHQEDALATINHYEIVGSHVGDYYHILPFVSKPIGESRKETLAIIKDATPYIMNKMPFSTREWDVFQELCEDNATNAQICEILKIKNNTLRDHFDKIRSKIEIIAPELQLSPREFAKKLHHLGLT